MIKDMGRIAVIHRGEWEEGSSYDRLDVVSCGGSSYMCVSPTAERPPSASWKIVALKGDAFTYGDFSEEQIASLMQPATDAAKRADDAIGRVDEEHRRLEQIREESASAVERSKTAATKANTAAGEAKHAATKADTAAGEAADAAGLAETAKINANTAAGEAKSAATKADTAARKADGAAETAGTAAGTATEAAKKADAAAGKADGMAKKAEASAEKADIATGKANEATVAATNAATKANEVEAKLTGNILKGKAKDTFIHVDDAFPSSLLSVEIEGATAQVSTTGANLFDVRKFIPNNSAYGLTVSVEEGFICISGTASGIGDIQDPSFSIGQYADNSLSGKQLNLKVFGAPSNITRVYGLRTVDETQIAVVASMHDGDTIDCKFLLAVSVDTLAEYEPYTGGKPSPSAEYPQDLNNLTKAELKVAGKNFADIDESDNVNFILRKEL